MITWGGIIITPIIDKSINLLPLNLFLANAYPVIVQKNILPIVTAMATNNEFSIYMSKESEESASL